MTTRARERARAGGQNTPGVPAWCARLVYPDAVEIDMAVLHRLLELVVDGRSTPATATPITARQRAGEPDPGGDHNRFTGLRAVALHGICYSPRRLTCLGGEDEKSMETTAALPSAPRPAP